MAHRTKINGTAYEISGGKTKINGTGYSISKGRTKVGGTGYNISFGTPASSLAVGRSIYFNVDGSETEFIVAHQGNPDSSIYDSSCNGTWVMMYDALLQRDYFNSSNYSNYANSTLHSYLSTTFLGKLDSDVQSAIKQVKIPYGYAGAEGVTKTGSNGLSTKVFTLSVSEMFPKNTEYGTILPLDGTQLDYFSSYGCNDLDVHLVVRSVGYMMGTQAIFVYPHDEGAKVSFSAEGDPYFRPMFILPSDFDVSSYL